VTAGLPYLAESAFPVYWLHQSAIVLLGYPLLKLELGIAAKYLLLLLGSVSATLAVYHFVVRRFALTRFLVGMKPLPPRAPAHRLVRAAAAGQS
jgi:membrane-bound acyltransferase YfiQ involved in biofilm formation